MDWKLYLVAGGPVVLILFLLLIILIILVTERIIFFIYYEKQIYSYIQLISSENLDIEKILANNTTNQNLDVSFIQLLTRLKSQRFENLQHHMIYFDEVFEMFFNEEHEKMEKFITIFATFGNLSPFIGLLGTVFGIIRSFLHLGEVNIAEVNKGIAEALVATAVGLIVAIPSSIFYNYFRRRIERVNINLDKLKSYLKIKFLNSLEIHEKA